MIRKGQYAFLMPSCVNLKFAIKVKPTSAMAIVAVESVRTDLDVCVFFLRSFPSKADEEGRFFRDGGETSYGELDDSALRLPPLALEAFAGGLHDAGGQSVPSGPSATSGSLSLSAWGRGWRLIFRHAG